MTEKRAPVRERPRLVTGKRSGRRRLPAGDVLAGVEHRQESDRPRLNHQPRRFVGLTLSGAEPELAPDSRATVAKLRAMRRPGDSFSHVILALAKDERV